MYDSIADRAVITTTDDVVDTSAIEVNEEDVMELERVRSISQKNNSKSYANGNSKSNIKRENDSNTIIRRLRVSFKDWWCTILIGSLVVSYWRGTWVIFDIYLCDQPHDASLIEGSTFCFAIDFLNPIRIRSGCISYIVGNLLLMIVLYLSWEDIYSVQVPGILTWYKSLLRFGFLYMLGGATVNLWRGIWYLTDGLIWTDSIEKSMTLTTILGLLCCFSIGCGASLIATPAIFLLDGPGFTTPPIVRTILETYYGVVLPEEQETLPTHHHIVKIIDIAITFLILPIFVVWFWRGCWGLLDILLWDFSPNHVDLYFSLGYGAVIAIVGFFVCSKDVIDFFPKVPNRHLIAILRRIRTVILAISTVSFWRLIWYIWDEFLGKTTEWSAWLSHFVGVTGLLCMGCFSSVAAPPTSIGVDVVPHPEAAEEILFHDLPISAESLYFMGICRQPPKLGSGEDIEGGILLSS